MNDRLPAGAPQEEKAEFSQQTLLSVQGRLQGAQGASLFGACAAALLLAHGAEINSPAARGLGTMALAVAAIVVLVERRRAIATLTECLEAAGVPTDLAKRRSKEQVSQAFRRRAPSIAPAPPLKGRLPQDSGEVLILNPPNREPAAIDTSAPSQQAQAS